MKVIFVHHTADTNAYTANDVPLLLRSIYSYQLNNGWCDIAYNSIIDKYGRIWEARSGGMDKPVLSGATGGFNSNSWAVSLLGNYMTSSVPSAAYDALRRLVAWRLVVAGENPLGTNVLVQSAGGTTVGAKWNDGDAVSFNVVSGHRDAVYTDCPGNLMYTLMGQLRGDVDAAIGALPFGAVDSVTSSTAGLRVTGWAVDPGSTAPIDVHVYVDATGVATTAAWTRGDVAATYPVYGASHGFDVTIPAVAGSHVVCVYAINIAGGWGNPLLGCTSISHPVGGVLTPPNVLPIGRLDAATWTGTGIHTYGWSLDPDTTDPVNVNVWIDNTGYSLVANTNRGDIANAYPAYGPNHGYDTTLPATPGPHRVCAYAINLPINGAAATLGCTTITVPDNPTPIGRLDAATWTGTGIHTYGWSLDPDTTDPVNVNVWIDNTGYSLVANTNRGDIANAYPAYGPNHGYDTTLPATPGPHRVCAYAINLPINGAAATLGCTTITVPDNPTPIGRLDAATWTGTGIHTYGWSLDPDTTDPVNVNVWIDNTGYSLVANTNRGDIANAYPAYGPNHGYDTTLPATPGPHRVCAYAINLPINGAAATLGCTTITVP
ncbi:MAG: N-acetylmuramoyl-L-alanine amidase [Dermatophilaceae bacterium]